MLSWRGCGYAKFEEVGVGGHANDVGCGEMPGDVWLWRRVINSDFTCRRAVQDVMYERGRRGCRAVLTLERGVAGEEFILAGEAEAKAV